MTNTQNTSIIDIANKMERICVKGNDFIMLKKYWKKIGFIILIIACVFNVMIKLINKLSLDKEMLYSAQYMDKNEKNETKNK